MPISMNGDLAILDAHCAIEEAETLLDWLRATACPRVDLSGCTHMHAAVLQTLLVMRPTVVAAPTTPFLAHFLVGLPSAGAVG
ncbi:hypothetical protein [Paracraurococcus lichenis]|uniref:STAS domain-containing protein n=1 Tax=Paracraurococcus lichenis TaxID=3064888 RepID=A0ABT9E6E3_9PROT|nr:hypothetical protein [Paracraurococcus sp. LOR1-02]MDO9711689.1 hypothetical protein [Paracraurococcus sp. LOR1-02]